MSTNNRPIAMKSLTPYFVLLITLLAPSASQGANIVLRERATQHGPIIRLGDIADIAAATPAEMHDLTSTPLFAAPAPGTQQFLHVSQVRELLLARGIRLENTSLRGAKVVQIGSTTITTTKRSTTQLATKSRQEIERLVQQAIKSYLQSTTNHLDWRVEVVLEQDELQQFAHITENLQAHGQRHTHSGRQRFTFTTNNSDQNQKQNKNLAITAKIAKLQSVVVVKHRIEKGQLVRTADVEIRQREGNLPSESFVNLEQAIGKEAKRALRAEEILQQSHVRAPWQVKRGESVNVYVRTGGIVVRTRAIASENGAVGDLISVELPGDNSRNNSRNKKQLDASVSGPGEVTVFATGGQTIDFASLNRAANRAANQRR